MTHHTTITPHPATEPGALDGYRVDCETCGFVGSSSLETLARTMYAEGHRRYMEQYDTQVALEDPFAGLT